MTRQHDGKCACGAVRFRLQAAGGEASAGGGASVCHCAMCRRWCGGLPFASVYGMVSLTAGEKDLRWWKGSPWGERGFCGVCGSSLFWRAGGAEKWSASVGALADGATDAVARHIFTDEAGGYYQFADDAPRFTGAQHVAAVFAELKTRFGEEEATRTMAMLREHNGDAFADEVEKQMRGGGE